MWNKIITHSNLIKHETEKAYLIKLPRRNQKFWFPKKLVEFRGEWEGTMILNYCSTMEIRVDGKIMDIETFVSIFDGECTDTYDESYVIVEEPAPIEVDGGVVPCLLNN